MSKWLTVLTGTLAVVTPTGLFGQVTAFVNVSIVPMNSERVLPGQTVLIRGNRIAEIGPVGKVQVPGDAARIDGQGKFLMPGMSDMHTHLTYWGAPECRAPAVYPIRCRHYDGPEHGLFPAGNDPLLRLDTAG
jgi:hypothetical protein